MLGTIALFYGWWELGRAVSLSPIEIAKVFDAPLLNGKGTSAEIGELLNEIGPVRVRYGEPVQCGMMVNSEMSTLIERNLKRKGGGLRYGDDDDDGNNDIYGG